MLLSELIDQLNDAYRVHGDLEVWVETDTDCENVSRVEFEDAFNAIVIEGVFA